MNKSLLRERSWFLKCATCFWPGGFRVPRRRIEPGVLSPRDAESPRPEAGFTLLETMIAMAIMMIAFASILMVQSSSLRSAMKSKQLNLVSMLARNKLVESELELEGKTFAEVQDERSGEFPQPYQDYKWKRKIEEVKFPSFNMGAAGGGGEEGGGDQAAAGGDLITRVGRVVTAYFSKAVREIRITITWTKGKGEQTYTVATYWIDLDAEFSLNE